MKQAQNPEVTQFWNQSQIVQSFHDSPLQSYWVDYFNALGNKHEKRVLDMGCGGGRYTQMLTEMGYQVSAIDLHESMVQVTRERLGVRAAQIDLRQGSMTELLFEDNKFDVVLTNGVLHNAETVREFEISVSEVARVTRPEGNLCLNVFFDNGLNTEVTQVSDKLFTTRDSLPLVLYPEPELLNLLSQNGYKPGGEVVTYVRNLDVGDRAVLRGVFNMDRKTA